MKKHLPLAFAAMSGAALVLVGQLSFSTWKSPFPPPNAIREVRRSAVSDAIALSLGLRRLAADLWFIRLIQYYGGRSQEELEASRRGELSQIYGRGSYPEFSSMASHILALDPYFTNAGLFAAGALAFNMYRPDEAVEFLNGALLHNPREWKYLTLLSAIGYSKAKDPAKIADIINPLLNEPDCPVMLRQLGAFLNKKVGNYKKAYFIYRTILETSKDPYYIENAKKEMKKLEPRLRSET